MYVCKILLINICNDSKILVYHVISNQECFRMEIDKSNRVKNTAFKGYQHKKTAEGSQSFEFNYMYDSAKYNFEVQFFRVGFDKKNNYYISRGCDGEMEPFYTSNVPKEGVKIDPSYDLELSQNEPFAYRFVLKDKNTGEILNYPRGW